METIRTYIDNMFMALPKTEQVERAKTDLLEMMEDKYNALKEEGKSENEAVGHVISEFGNIDELTRELGIETEQKEKTPEKKSRREIILSDKEVDEFLSVRKKSSVGIGIGVMLLILAPAALIFLNALFDNGFAGDMLTEGFAAAIPVGVLLAFIGIGIAVLIINGTKMSSYEKFEDKKLVLTDAKRAEIEKAHKSYLPKFAVLIASGFMFIAAGVVQVIIFTVNDDFAAAASVSALLACIAVAVLLFILAGIRHGSNMQLLNMDEDEDDDDDDDDDDKAIKHTKAGRIGEAITSCLWMLTLIAYFLWSFLGHAWNISWILFPIAGFLSGAIDAIVKASAGSEEK